MVKGEKTLSLLLLLLQKTERFIGKASFSILISNDSQR